MENRVSQFLKILNKNKIWMRIILFKSQISADVEIYMYIFNFDKPLTYSLLQLYKDFNKIIYSMAFL